MARRREVAGRAGRRARSGARAKPGAAEMVRAARAADLAALRALVARGGDVNARWRNYRPLHALIQEEPHAGPAAGRASPERLACLDWLLANGADPDARGAWPSARAVLVAAFTGVPEMVARLRGRSRDDVFVASARGDAARVARLLERDAGAAEARDAEPGAGSEEGLTALHCAAASRLGAADARVLARLRAAAARLLDAGADPDARVRTWGQSVDAAYFAAGTEHVEMLALLLERGADANAALASAAWKPRHELAEACLARGAEPDRALHEGRPILNELVRWGQVAQALWLLERGASPDAPDARGWTAVHQAASRGNERLLRALLDAGGDPRREARDGKTPLDVARAKRRPALVALLGGGTSRTRAKRSPRRRPR